MPRRLSLSNKVWLAFFIVALLVAVALGLSHLVHGDEEVAEGLTDALRSKGEPFGDCLVRVQQENPSYGKELSERFFQGG